jgi:hypothetical protein
LGVDDADINNPIVWKGKKEAKLQKGRRVYEPAGCKIRRVYEPAGHKILYKGS